MVPRKVKRKILFGDRLDGYAVNDCGCARWKLWGYWRSTDRSLAAWRGPLNPRTLAAALAELRTRTASSAKSSVNTSAYTLQYCDYRILLWNLLLGSHWTRTNLVTDYSTRLRDQDSSPQLHRIFYIPRAFTRSP